MRKYNSERIEPFATYLIGVGGMKVIEARDKWLEKGDEDYLLWFKFANEIMTFWYLFDEVLGTLSALTAGDAVHFGVVSTNETLKNAEFIKSLCGVCPIAEKEKFERRDFSFNHLKNEEKK